MMSESVSDRFDDTVVYTEIIDDRDDIEDRLAHGKQLTPSQARQVRQLVKQWSPPDNASGAAQAVSMFGHRLKRFTQMLRAACYQQPAYQGGAAEDLRFLVEMGETVLRDRVVGTESEIAMAALRGIRRKGEFLVAHGGCVGSGKFAELMGVQRETPRKRWETGKLVGVKSGNQLQLPIWQLQEPDATGVLRVLPGIPEIVRIIRANHGNDWDVFSFFLTENVHLIDESAGRFRTPLEALRANEEALVIDVAEASFAVQ